MSLRRIIDASPGELRWGLFSGVRPIELGLLRASDLGRRARFGELYRARVRAISPHLRGAFVDLGLAAEAFMPFTAGGPRLTEGQAIEVEITREGVRGKGPVVLLRRPASGDPARLQPGPEESACAGAGPASAVDREALDAAFVACQEARAAIPGGGALIIEPTAALVAIDVDSAGRTGEAVALNEAAAFEALAQLRLRALGGLAVIDFVSMKAPAHRKRVEAAVRAAAAEDPWGVITAPMSRFGLIEVSRAQRARPHHEAFAETAQIDALAALRALEREAAHARGRGLRLLAAPASIDWLSANTHLWRSELEQRIGPRFFIQADPQAGFGRFAVALED